MYIVTTIKTQNLNNVNKVEMKLQSISFKNSKKLKVEFFDFVSLYNTILLSS